MIKIQPSGTTAKFSTGLNSPGTRSVRGRLGDGAREHVFQAPHASLKASWKDNALEASIRAQADIHISRITLAFSFHSPKPKGETAVWTDTPEVSGNGGYISVKKKRPGGGALWLSEAHDAEGILFRQSPPAACPVTFTCHPGSRTLEICWNVEASLEEGETLALPKVGISRGHRTRLVDAWFREWRKASVYVPQPDRRLAWRESGEAGSPDGVREMAAALKAAPVPVSWFALGPEYATATGDWMVPVEEFRDRMGNTSRAVSEQNFIPGLRFAPFLVSRKSAIASDHKSWLLLRNSGGKPVQVKAYEGDRDPCWILDITNPEVQDHLRKIFIAMRDQWGFRAFILERLEDLALPGFRSNSSIGPGALWDSAAGLIREILGSRVYIAAAGIPLFVSAGSWDARFVSGSLRDCMDLKSDCSRLAAASQLLHRSGWSEGCWSNATPPLPPDLFRPDRTPAACTLLNAAAVSTGLSIFCGDPRKMSDEMFEAIRDYISLFEESRKGSLRIAGNVGGGTVTPLVVRNDTGRIGLFNLSRRKKEIRLDRDGLKEDLGVASRLSAGDGAVFNSPEIHVALPPRGNRLFRG